MFTEAVSACYSVLIRLAILKIVRSWLSGFE